MELRLDGKRALITAGGGGIGQVIAETFHDVGALVHVCDINADGLKALRARAAGVRTTEADVSDPAAVDRVFEDAVGWMDGLDILVNNAGVSGPTKPIEEVTDEEWAHTLGVNLTGAFHCVRKAVPLFDRAGGGRIVGLSSAAGRLGFPLRVPYSTAKFGVVGFTEALAMELGRRNITVNCIQPGAVDGERYKRICREQGEARGMTYEEYLPMMLHNVSMQTLVGQDEIANMVLYLCSDAGRHISGQSIGVCGNVESLRGPFVVGENA